MDQEKRVVIVGGGFGGIRAALDLAKNKIDSLKITLISDKSYFEYKPTLYRIVTGRLPFGVCVPLRDIFSGKDIEFIEDRVSQVDLKAKTLRGESGAHYNFNFLILALGSQTAYFDIPGLETLSFSLKSIDEAVKLARHLHKVFAKIEKGTTQEKVEGGHIVIIGGGATGTELAGELAYSLQELSKKHGIDKSFVKIDLIEAKSRLLDYLPEDISERVHKRLRELGVNIYLNRRVIKEEVEKIFMKDMEMKTKTVIWTAGTKPNSLYRKIDGLDFNSKERVLVDEFLQAKGFENIFIIGDAASSPYAGLAQTALHQGKYAAKTIIQKAAGRETAPYEPKPPAFAIPIGQNWAALTLGPIKLYGRIGWWIRRLADLRFFLSILPPVKALKIFFSKRDICELCSICYPLDG